MEAAPAPSERWGAEEHRSSPTPLRAAAPPAADLLINARRRRRWWRTLVEGGRKRALWRRARAAKRCVCECRRDFENANGASGSDRARPHAPRCRRSLTCRRPAGPRRPPPARGPFTSLPVQRRECYQGNGHTQTPGAGAASCRRRLLFFRGGDTIPGAAPRASMNHVVVRGGVCTAAARLTPPPPAPLAWAPQTAREQWHRPPPPARRCSRAQCGGQRGWVSGGQVTPK